MQGKKKRGYIGKMKYVIKCMGNYSFQDTWFQKSLVSFCLKIYCKEYTERWNSCLIWKMPYFNWIDMHHVHWENERKK